MDQTLHHLALSYFKEERYEEALATWTRFPNDYPESRGLPEALYHIGLCHLRLGRSEEASLVFKELISAFPDSRWADESNKRLLELYGLNHVFQTAMDFFDQGHYTQAYTLFSQTKKMADKPELRRNAAYFAAISLFKVEQWPQALDEFAELIDRYPQSKHTTEAHFHLGLINLHLGETEKARHALREVVDVFPGTRWSAYSRQVLESLEPGANR